MAVAPGSSTSCECCKLNNRRGCVSAQLNTAPWGVVRDVANMLIGGSVQVNDESLVIHPLHVALGGSKDVRVAAFEASGGVVVIYNTRDGFQWIRFILTKVSAYNLGKIELLLALRAIVIL